MTGQAPPERCDAIVVGAGIVGLAVARELLLRAPGSEVVVLERAGDVGHGQTGHSSGVIHAGLYYAPGSMKARLCVEGARQLRSYCAAQGIEAHATGKLVVAIDEGELPRLDELERRARANGVTGIRRRSGDEIASIEPHACGVAALHSPQTGTVDFRAVAAALADDVAQAGGRVVTGCEVTAVAHEPGAAGGVRIGHSHGETRAARAIFCAGLESDRLAQLAGAEADPRIVPFRGSYLRLDPSKSDLVRGLIYPVPDPALPFLGVHLTRIHDGSVLVGPTARPLFSRDTLTWPGTWRMARRWWRTGASELLADGFPSIIARAAARYVPDLRPRDFEPAWSGLRAQAVARDGTLLDDFALSAVGSTVHVRNAPSPAATAALALAREIADRADRLLA